MTRNSLILWKYKYDILMVTNLNKLFPSLYKAELNIILVINKSIKYNTCECKNNFINYIFFNILSAHSFFTSLSTTKSVFFFVLFLHKIGLIIDQIYPRWLDSPCQLNIQQCIMWNSVQQYCNTSEYSLCLISPSLLPA